MTTPLMVTVKDAAAILGIGPAHVYALATDGTLEKKYIGKGTRNFRITYVSLERYVDSLSQDPVAS